MKVLHENYGKPELESKAVLPVFETKQKNLP